MNSQLPSAAPRYLLPSTVMLTPDPWKTSVALDRCCGFTISQVLLGFAK